MSLTLEDSIFYLAEVLVAIQQLHERNIIYRDLKPENILINDEGVAKIADFGLSKWLRRRQRTGTICGTLAFMAPEVASGSLYEHSVDLWSLGILLYCLAFARYPFPR